MSCRFGDSFQARPSRSCFKHLHTLNIFYRSGLSQSFGSWFCFRRQTLRTKRTLLATLYGRPSQLTARGQSVGATQIFVARRDIGYGKASFNLFPSISEIQHPSILKNSEVCLWRHMTLLTFYSLAVSLHITRFNIQTFYVLPTQCM